MEQKDIIKVRVHDGIVGLIYLGSGAAADQFGISFISNSCSNCNSSNTITSNEVLSSIHNTKQNNAREYSHSKWEKDLI